MSGTRLFGFEFDIKVKSIDKAKLTNFDQHYWTDEQYTQAIDNIKQIIDSENFKSVIAQHGEYILNVTSAIYGDNDFILAINGMLEQVSDDYKYRYTHCNDMKKEERFFIIKAYPKN